MKTIILSLVLVGMVGIVGLGALNRSQQTEAQPNTCQYPLRPNNPDGSCDNSDPCDPTTIKEPGLYGDCRDSKPKIKEKKQKSKLSPAKPTTTLIGK